MSLQIVLEYQLPWINSFLCKSNHRVLIRHRPLKRNIFKRNISKKESDSEQSPRHNFLQQDKRYTIYKTTTWTKHADYADKKAPGRTKLMHGRNGTIGAARNKATALCRLKLKKAPNSEARARLAQSLINFNFPNFKWSPVELCQFLMNASMAQLMNDPKEEENVTRWRHVTSLEATLRPGTKVQ